ncbi:hypothetical protein FA13DRAFT_1042506 [Coprinellus micaceus]|uniref:Uncharacterized protein n=1 Tax=Coprinellus micaceus TaxID=71717 RepID=A0A4Y7SXT8_COPMI|nr:hypothetical protein FA13DRAFT_1042506 [Coprinellus micaceus]
MMWPRRSQRGPLARPVFAFVVAPWLPGTLRAHDRALTAEGLLGMIGWWRIGRKGRLEVSESQPTRVHKEAIPRGLHCLPYSRSNIRRPMVAHPVSYGTSRLHSRCFKSHRKPTRMHITCRMCIT